MYSFLPNDWRFAALGFVCEPCLENGTHLTIRNQESGNVYLSQNTQIILYKNIVNIMRNNYIEWENPKHNDVNSKKKVTGDSS